MTSPERVDHLRGSAAQAHQRRLSERAELEADLKAIADAVFCFTSADALRNKIGRASVLRIARLAGRDPAALRDQWSEDDKRVQQQSTLRTGEGYEGDPAHDSRVVAEIMSGASAGKVNSTLAAVRREFAQEAAERHKAANGTRRPQPGVVTEGMGQAELFRALEGAQGHHDLPAPGWGASQDPVTGAPVQRSAVNHAVPELGSEDVGPVPMSDVRTVVTPDRSGFCTEHAGPAGDRFCSVCGRPRPRAAEAMA